MARCRRNELRMLTTEQNTDCPLNPNPRTFSGGLLSNPCFGLLRILCPQGARQSKSPSEPKREGETDDNDETMKEGTERASGGVGDVHVLNVCSHLCSPVLSSRPWLLPHVLGPVPWASLQAHIGRDAAAPPTKCRNLGSIPEVLPLGDAPRWRPAWIKIREHQFRCGSIWEAAQDSF